MTTHYIEWSTIRTRLRGSTPDGSRIAAVLCLALCASLWGGRADGVSAAPQRQAAPADILATTELDPDRDTLVASGRPDTNFGADRSLMVGWRSDLGAARTLLLFDMDEIDRDRAITGAELRMYQREARPSGDPARNVVVRRVTDDWREGNVTWNAFPRVDDERLATTAVGTSTGIKTWRDDALTDLAQRWRWPDWQRRHRENHGLYVQGYEDPSAASYRLFDSDEGDRDPVLRLTHVEDDRAPSARLKRLPEYINAPDPDRPGTAEIDLEWTFEDPSPATGVDFLRLDRQRGDGPFVVLEEELRRSSLTVRGENGRRYGFRILATDMAGNEEREGPAETVTLVDLSPPEVAVQPLPEFTNRPFTVRWDGTDLPEGPGLENSGIWTYDVFYQINRGGWGALELGTTATSVRVEPAVNVLYEFRARAIDRAGNVQPLGSPQASIITDARPPRTSIEPVSGIDRRVFTVRWDAVDPGQYSSGIAGIDVQYRVGTGPWRQWVTDTLDRSRVFEGEFSNVYGFRARARDRAGNEQPWPSNPQIYVGVIDRDILIDAVYLPDVHVAR